MTIYDFLGGFNEVIVRAIAVVIGLAVVGYLYKLAQLISDKDGSKQKLRDAIVWGMIALFVMVTLWGIVALLEETFFTERITEIDI